MFRKNHYTFLLAIALFFVGTTAAFAQTGQARGKVELKNADGTTAPLADVALDIYRTDIKGKLPSAKTNKKGEFVILGLIPGGRYAIAVSGATITSDVFPDIKAGDEKLTITVVPGNGKPMTEEEVRQMLANAPKDIPTAELTAEQKKQQEEYLKQVADVEKSNKNTENINAIVNRSLKEGDEQFKAKNYDVAIARYDEGFNADPNFVGSAPVFLTKKATALINRATDKSNENAKAAPTVKAQAMVSVKKDYEDAILALDKSLTLLKESKEADPKVVKELVTVKSFTLEKRTEAYRLIARTGADRTKGKAARAAFQEYIDASTDPKVKANAQIMLAESLQESNDFDLAIVEFEKILAVEPNNVDALAGISLSLVNVGYSTFETDPAKGKEQFQQAANYLQKYLDVAPDTHKYKLEAKGIIETLKTEQGISSQKGAKTTKKKN